MSDVQLVLYYFYLFGGDKRRVGFLLTPFFGHGMLSECLAKPPNAPLHVTACTKIGASIWPIDMLSLYCVD